MNRLSIKRDHLGEIKQTNVPLRIPPHSKLRDIFLEEDTLTLWKPSVDSRQYYLIPGSVQDGDLTPVLQTYYTKFDCVTSILTFDDAVPIFASQSTSLRPTDDYSVLRDYHKIRGLWFKPDIEEQLGPEEETTLGNIKLSIALAKYENESIFSNMNIYFLEVLDYPAEDKSVSRLLVTKTRHTEFESYDMFKQGGPVYMKKNSDVDGDIDIHYLRVCHNFTGRKWRHEVEFMLEEDPWPMCKIIPVNNRCRKRPTITVVRDLGISLPCRYMGATWRETLAGLFVWSLRTYIVWLIFERLHDKVKNALDKATNHVNIREVIHTECPVVCKSMFETYEILSTFIAKCENEQDLKDLLDIFLSLHKCDEGNCSLVSLKSLNAAHVLPGILFLLEKTIACASPQFRFELTSTIMPWSVMGYYCSDLKIRSHRKMVIFISQLPGINTDLEPRALSPTPFFTGGDPSSGYGSAPVTPNTLFATSVHFRRRRSSQISSVSSLESP
ncbi:uncharacterized protein LOC127847412 isoform X2 [Dreissena polymorpha]|uniref:uncharacterized protein LOC127847412 isoform X2 n=1 Tax=Dreissena polymorpha TaxID=45954 RepID=UPI002264739F|nr:uncharacterized protein LOC127847412 isoform X2 [Dreissena polymorpha]